MVKCRVSYTLRRRERIRRQGVKVTIQESGKTYVQFGGTILNTYKTQVKKQFDPAPVRTIVAGDGNEGQHRPKVTDTDSGVPVMRGEMCAMKNERTKEPVTIDQGCPYDGVASYRARNHFLIAGFDLTIEREKVSVKTYINPQKGRNEGRENQTKMGGETSARGRWYALWLDGCEITPDDFYVGELVRDLDGPHPASTSDVENTSWTVRRRVQDGVDWTNVVPVSQDHVYRLMEVFVSLSFFLLVSFFPFVDI